MKKIVICEYCGKDERDENDEEFRHHGCPNKTKAKCTICDNFFASGLILRRHIESVHQGMIYKCVEWDKTFTTLDAMKRHQKTHNGKKEHTCNICHKEFSRSETLM